MAPFSRGEMKRWKMAARRDMECVASDGISHRVTHETSRLNAARRQRSLPFDVVQHHSPPPHTPPPVDGFICHPVKQ